MIKLLIVGGEKTDELQKYLEDRGGGSLRIERKYPSLFENKLKIEDDIINVNKLVYTLWDSNVTVRKDMATLKSLLLHGEFFTTEEILLFVQKSPLTDKGLAFFKSAMLESGFKNYRVVTTESDLSFSFIYEELLGLANPDRITNRYNKVYLRERGTDSKKSYDIEDNFNVSIEPFSYSNLKQYDKIKQVAVQSETGIPIHDDNEIEIPKYDNPKLDSVEPTYAHGHKNVNVISGLSKSGKSTYATALAVSTVMTETRTLVLDLSTSSGTSIYLNKELEEMRIKQTYNFNHINLRLSDLLLNKYDLQAYNTFLISTSSIPNTLTKMDCLRYVLSNSKKFNVDNIIIDCDDSELEYVLNILPQVNKLFITSQDIESDFDRTRVYIDKYRQDYDMVIFLNANMTTAANIKHLLPADIKKIITHPTLGTIPIVKPMSFKTIYKELNKSFSLTLLKPL